MRNSKLAKLINFVAKLPGIGERSAKRLVLNMLKNRQNIMLPLAQMLEDSAKNIVTCAECGNLDDSALCSICNDTKRDSNTLCVVENVGDLLAIEKSEIYSGLYFVLGGSVSSATYTPDDLRIAKLLEAISTKSISEVIIATNPTIQGQTTAFYITEKLKSYNVKITRPASGLPVGAELDYMDEGTLLAAFSSRHKF